MPGCISSGNHGPLQLGREAPACGRSRDHFNLRERSDIRQCLGLSLGPPAIAGVRSNGVQFITNWGSGLPRHRTRYNKLRQLLAACASAPTPALLVRLSPILGHRCCCFLSAPVGLRPNDVDRPGTNAS